MRIYQLNPASISYEEGRAYTESEIIWWAEDVAFTLNQIGEDPTLIFDQPDYTHLDIHLAITVLEQVNEFVEPVIP